MLIFVCLLAFEVSKYTDFSKIYPFYDLVPYSQNILNTLLSLVINSFLYIDTFESNTTSDWLNRMVNPIRRHVTFKANPFRKTQRERS